MDNNKDNNFAAALFKKGANTVELIFAERLNRLPYTADTICVNDSVLLDMMLFAYLLGACACVQDQASIIELQEAIDNVFIKETPNP